MAITCAFEPEYLLIFMPFFHVSSIPWHAHSGACISRRLTHPETMSISIPLPTKSLSILIVRHEMDINLKKRKPYRTKWCKYTSLSNTFRHKPTFCVPIHIFIVWQWRFSVIVNHAFTTEKNQKCLTIKYIHKMSLF